MRYLALFFISFLCLHLSAQEIKTDYLKATGKIPLEFRTLSSNKFKKTSAAIVDKGKVKRSKKQFLLESNFLTDELLISGRVLFNDPVSNYINEVASKLIGTDKALKDSLRFYAVKSPVVNAFSTNQGYIMINLGLIAQLENEAQLAYILSHEIIHFKRKHSIKEYVKQETSRKEFRKMSTQDQLLAKSAYSKEQETQADLEGLELYLKSSYSRSVFNHVFDVLEYSYLPYEDKPFEISHFESPAFKLKPSYQLINCNEIKPEVDADSSYKTHPSINNRREKLLDKFSKSKQDPNNGSLYLVSETNFKKVRNIARQELSRLHNENKSYAEAGYNAFLLLKENPKNNAAKEQLLFSLYMLAKYKNRDELTKIMFESSKIQGKSQAFYHFIEKIQQNELTALALNFGWKLKKETKDPLVDKICRDLFKELQYKEEVSFNSFIFEKPATQANANQATTKPISNPENLSKYEKIRQNKTQKEEITLTGDTNNSFKYSFVEFAKDPDFESYFKNAIAELNAEKMAKESKELAKKEAKIEAIAQRKGYALGIEKTLIIDPDFARIDERKKNAVRHLDAEEKQLELNEYIKQYAAQHNLSVELISPILLQESEVQKFNDHHMLNSWINELSQHNFYHVNLFQKEVDELASRNNTPYCTWQGLVAFTEKKDFPIGYIFASLIYPFTLPFAIAYAATPEHTTFYYCFVYNIKTGDLVMKELNKIKMGSTNTVVKSNVYNSLAQIKNKR